ncbi:MAG: MerR family transcriptional regulator [Acidobacteriia bacterium]|nr:MerR family transcriptional regulator [Terriglobia bacterium]
MKNTIKYNGFSTNKVSAMTGISARQLRWWEEQRLIKPGALPGRKSGQTRRYTLQDLICIIIVKALRDKGVSLQKIRKSVDSIKRTGVQNPLSQLRVACLANRVVFKKGDNYLEISGQAVIQETLEKIRPELRRRGISEQEVEIANRDYLEKVAAF